MVIITSIIIAIIIVMIIIIVVLVLVGILTIIDPSHIITLIIVTDSTIIDITLNSIRLGKRINVGVILYSYIMIVRNSIDSSSGCGIWLLLFRISNILSCKYFIK